MCSKAARGAARGRITRRLSAGRSGSVIAKAGSSATPAAVMDWRLMESRHAAAADSAAGFVAQRGSGYPASFLPLRIPCGGRLDTLYVLEAFKQGFDAVCVYRCREGHCHNLIGNLDMDRRINLLRAVLRSRNLDDARLRIVDISPFEGEQFVQSVEGIFDSLSLLTNGKGGAL